MLLSISAFPFLSFSAFASSLTVPAGETASTTVTLPAGADLLRVTADWSPVSGDPRSNQLELTVLAPEGVTAFAAFFDNALSDSSAPVPGLTASPRLTSQGGAGEYTLEFANTSEHPVALDNITAEPRALLDSIEISGALSPASPTFERPDEDGSPSGRTTRYSAATFTPEFSGTYTLHTSFTYDGVLILYEGDQPDAPFTDFIAANDESPGGLFTSFLQLSLTAGQPYTIVGTSFSSGTSGNFTHRIRFSGPVEPDTPVDPLTTFSAYRDFYDTGDPFDDDNGNGLANLLEYALGRTPSDPYSAPTTTEVDEGVLSIRFFRDPDLTDIAYIVEVTDDLTTWTEVYNSSADSAPNNNGDFMIITDPGPHSGFRSLRLRVELLDPPATPTTFTDYQSTFGTGGAEDDDNGNGLSNLLEYALGRTPSDPYAPPATTQVDEGVLSIRFFRDPALTDIAYIVEVTDDLATWTEVYNSSTDPAPNNDGDFMIITDPGPHGGFRSLRLRVELLDPPATPTTFTDYQSTFGTGGAEDDDNGNGLANLLEYALGRTPTDPYEPPFSTFTEDGLNWVRFYRDPDLTDITYIVERTTNLTTWDTLYDSSLDSSPNSDGTHHEVQDPTPPTGFTAYRLRLKTQR